MLFEIAGPLRAVRAHRTMKLRCNATFVLEMVPQGLLPLVISSTLLASKTTNVPLFHMIFLKCLVYKIALNLSNNNIFKDIVKMIK